MKNTAEIIVGVIIFSILVEAITTIIKSLYKKNEGMQLPVIISITVAIALAVAYGIDLFALLGFSAGIPKLGAVLTGIIISRGSNFLFDLLKKVEDPLNGLGGNIDEL